MLRETAGRQKDKPAVLSAFSSVSYRQLDVFSDRIAGYLRKSGVQKGDKVALYCINSPWFVAGYFGILKLGATVVAVSLFLSQEELKYVLTDSQAVGLIYYEGFENNVAAVQGSLARPLTLITTGKSSRLGARNLEEVLAGSPEPVEIPEIDQRNQVAAILYTSGTTGQPKGAMLTHRNLLFNVNSVVNTLPVYESDVFLAVLPMFHAFGATACMLTPIALGAVIAAAPRFVPDEVARMIKKTAATIFLGVPSMYILFNHLPDEHKADFSSLRFCISGGAAMPREVMERFEEKYGVLIYEGDGPTECSPVTAVNRVGQTRKPGSIGPPVSGVEMKIVDEKGTALPDKEIGEIVVRGENVMKGYFGKPAETAESFFQDWFRTGDLGYRDPDGFFYIVDRKKDVIIVNGINVYPRVIEDVLYRHPAVAEAAVVPEPHALHGEVARAVITLKPGSTVSKQEILKYCREHLGHYEVPRIVEIVPELPKTPTGKIQKRLLLCKTGKIQDFSRQAAIKRVL